MRLYFGADHAGYPLKEALIEYTKTQGHDVIDLGAYNAEESVDYPDFAREVAEKVRENEGSFGILVCGSGIGVAIAANKLKRIRAANVHTVEEAHLARQHNNANVVTVGARTLDHQLARDIVDEFLKTDFEGGRHEVRIQKITDIEEHE